MQRKLCGARNSRSINFNEWSEEEVEVGERLLVVVINRIGGRWLVDVEVVVVYL
jgi:hypothetical protein